MSVSQQSIDTGYIYIYICIYTCNRKMQQELHSLPKQYNRIRHFQGPNSSGRNVKSKGEKRTGNISVKFCI